MNRHTIAACICGVVVMTSSQATTFDIVELPTATSNHGFQHNLFHSMDYCDGYHNKVLAWFSLDPNGVNTLTTGFVQNPDNPGEFLITADVDFSINIYDNGICDGILAKDHARDNDPSSPGFIGTAHATGTLILSNFSSDGSAPLYTGTGTDLGDINWDFNLIDTDSRLYSHLNPYNGGPGYDVTTGFRDWVYTPDNPDGYQPNTALFEPVMIDDEEGTQASLVLWGADGVESWCNDWGFVCSDLGVDLVIIAQTTDPFQREVPEPGELLLIAIAGIGIYAEYRRRRLTA